MGCQFPALGAPGVGEEDEAALVQPLQQHHAGIGKAILVHGRQRHGVRIVGLGLAGLLQPLGEKTEWFGRFGEITGC